MTESNDSHIADDLLKALRTHLVDREYYINPNFLQGINTLIWDHYQKEDDEVDSKIQDM